MMKYLFVIAFCFLFFPIAQAVEIGEIAPDNVGRDLNGDDTLISDYRGQVVVLMFYFNQTSGSRNDFTANTLGVIGDNRYNYDLLGGISAVSNFFNQRGGGNIVKFIASSFHGPFYKFRREVKRNKYDLDIHYTNDSGHRISAKYFNRGITLPVAFVINQRGEIAYRHYVYTDGLPDKISDNINTLLRQN